MAKKNKIRAEFRKNRAVRARIAIGPSNSKPTAFDDEAPPHDERVSGKGELTRQRTVHAAEQAGGDNARRPAHWTSIETCLARPRACRAWG